MAGSINKVILVGNVGKDPEIRTTQDGKKIASFSVATSERWRNKNSGEFVENTEWHRVVVFVDSLVTLVENYVRKGSKLYIEGTLRTRKWVDASGIERYTTEVALTNFNSSITLLDSRQGSEDQAGNNSFGKEMPEENLMIDDEIPF